jgi:hypothetical protein
MEIHQVRVEKTFVETGPVGLGVVRLGSHLTKVGGPRLLGENGLKLAKKATNLHSGIWGERGGQPVFGGMKG